MDRSQHYSLRWNNHQHHLLAAFDALLQVRNLSFNQPCRVGGLRKAPWQL
jgi:hypothetical protein